MYRRTRERPPGLSRAGSSCSAGDNPITHGDQNHYIYTYPMQPIKISHPASLVTQIERAVQM